MYGEPTAPVASKVVVMESVGGAMVSVRLTLAFCAGEPESVTLKVSGVALTTALGVPLINPLDAFRVRPVDNVPAVNCQV